MKLHNYKQLEIRLKAAEINILLADIPITNFNFNLKISIFLIINFM